MLQLGLQSLYLQRGNIAAKEPAEVSLHVMQHPGLRIEFGQVDLHGVITDSQQTTAAVKVQRPIQAAEGRNTAVSLAVKIVHLCPHIKSGRLGLTGG